LIEGVTATITSGGVQNSFQELGKLWTNLLDNLNSTVSTNQVQNLFDNVSAGLGQLMSNVFSPGMPGIPGMPGMPGMMTGRENRPKKDVTEIRFTPKEVVPEVKALPPA